MKIKTFGIAVLLTFLFQVPSHAALNWFKKKSETAPTPAATVTQTAADEDQKEQPSPVVKKATATAKEPLTKEEQDEIFEEQKDLKDLKDSDKVAKESVDTAIQNRSISNQRAAKPPVVGRGRAAGVPLIVRAPERPVQRPIVPTAGPVGVVHAATNPNSAVVRAPERPVRNPNASVARAPERPAGR